MTTEPDRVAAIARIADHAAQGHALIPRRLRSKADLAALNAAWMAQVQALEDALYALLTDTLDTAVGARLDQLGRVLLQPRGALDDDDYRAVLKATVLARTSRGTAADVCAVLRAMVPGNAPFTYLEGGACVVLEPAAELPIAAAVAILPLRLAKAGGVLLELIDPPSGSWFTFAGAGRLLEQADAASGFGDEAVVNSGGQLVGVVT